MLDIISSMVVLGSLQIASQPADERHPYGYGKAEPLAALAVATALLAAAIAISIQSVREILVPHHLPEPFTLVVLVVVVGSKEVMFRKLFEAGESIGSSAIKTDAWHHRSDALTSIAAFIGIGIALLGGKGYEAADDYAAVFAAGVIAFNGTRLFRSAWREILDAAPPREIVDSVRCLAGSLEGVQAIDKCLVRRSGLMLFVDIHVVVDGDLSVREGHDIAHRVKDALLGSELRIMDAAIHIEPHRDRRRDSTQVSKRKRRRNQR
jgi:cation diffusion facilitator family transporter